MVILTQVLALAAVALLAVAPPGRAQSADAAGQPSGVDEIVRPGDAIRVRVAGQEELSGEFVVDERGHVVLPHIGTRQVGGERSDDVRARVLQELFGALATPAVEVTMLRRVLVRGAVRRPGSYLLAPYEATVGDALLAAEGVGADGRTDLARVVRGDMVIDVRLGDRTRTGRVMLTSGDEVVIPLRSWFGRNPAVVAGLLSSMVTGLITVLIIAVQ